jgi:Zn-dependent oligopeptidase
MRLQKYIFLSLLCFIGCATPRIKNPYLRMCTRIDPDYIRDLIPATAQDFKKYAADAELEIQQLYNQLISVPAQERTFYNTVRVYDTIYIKLWIAKQVAATMSGLHKDSKTRAQARIAASKIATFEKKLYQSAGIERALQEYKIYGTDKKYNEKSVQKYISIALEKQAEYKNSEKSDLDHLLGSFAYNIDKQPGTLAVRADQLSGLSQEFQKSLVRIDRGFYQIPLTFHSFFEIMEHAEDSTLRKDFFHAFGKRGFPENLSLIQQIVQKRNAHAQEQGYSSFAEHAIQDNMLQDVGEVKTFLYDVIQSLQPESDKIYREMLVRKPASVEISSSDKIYWWDETFLKSYFRKNMLAVDDQAIAEYFSLEKTLPKVLHLYEQFFSISFQRDQQYAWWSDDVVLYRVSNERTNELIGYVFFDLLERDGKAQEQKHITLVPGIRDDCNLPCLSVSAVVTDYHKKSDGNVLLELHEVASLIHEIGHAVHACFGSTEFAEISGTQCARDFVEMPSQMFELWLDEPEVLREISSHYQTGKPLSHDKIKAIVKAQKHVKISQLLKHSFISLLMIELYEQGDRDPHEVARAVHAKVFPLIEYDPDYYIECNLAHFATYGPGYYSYVYTSMLSEKLFKKIKKTGILKESTGKKFSDYILAPGGGGNYHEMIYNFLNDTR